MKKLLLLFLLLCPVYLFAQSDTTKNKGHEVFCMVIASTKAFSTKFNLTVDYGQGVLGWSDQRVKDETGKVMSFNSIVDALNYMASQGWTFVNSFAAAEGGTIRNLNCLMKRWVNN